MNATPADKGIQAATADDNARGAKTEPSRLQRALREVYEQGCFDFNIHSCSGRGMNSETCLAIIGNNIDLLQLGFALAGAAAFNGRGSGDLPRAKSDSMGRGIVIYWPGTPYVADERGGDNE
jgi:hypothetical protein